MTTGEITIWDDNPERAASIYGKLAGALQKMKIKASLSIQSEPPLIARQNLTGKTPAIEIAGAYWRKTPGKEPGETDIANLLHKVLGGISEEKLESFTSPSPDGLVKSRILTVW